MELTTIAKPYAKAINDIALEDGNFENWQTILNLLAEISKDELSKTFVNSPKLNKQEKINFVTSCLTTCLNRKMSKQENNLINLLISSDRMSVSSSIAELFNTFTTSTDKKITVISAYKLSDDEKNQLIGDLKKKYNSDIMLNIEVDAHLIGGVVIKDGDTVIDLSINASVEKLAACLAKN